MADHKNVDYTSVPASVDAENAHTKKYNVSGKEKTGLRISKLVCFLLIMGALLLAALSALAVYLFVPNECAMTDEPPAALTKASMSLIPNLPSTSVPKKNMVKDVPLKRIPKHLLPKEYTIRMMPFLIEGNFTTHGYIAMEIECQEATDKIYLHAVEIDIDKNSLRVKFISGDYFLRVSNLTYDRDDQMYTLHLDRKTVPGEMYHVHMNFVSQLNDLNQGFYRSSYVDAETNSLRWLASTQFSPLDARRAFPCFDEPDFKATFAISLARPHYMTTLSNMPRIKTEDSEEMPGYTWDHYEVTPRMSTYLVAFVVSDLQPYEFNTDGRAFQIWSRKDVINQSIHSSTISPKILKYYEKYFDIKYPLPKLDMVAVPDFGFSAMENWGLIIFRENSLLLDEVVTMVETKSSLVSVMSHELTHQWFGNLVTPKFWSDLWLKEGIANFFMYRGVNHVEPTWNYTDEFLIDQQLVAMDRDSLILARPMSTEMKTSNKVREAFDKIAYSKGASVIHMLQGIYGEDNFREALRHFLNKHQYANADYNDFWEAFIERNQKIPGLNNTNDLKTILDTWITQAGFPVVTAIADYENNTLTLSQKRFFYSSPVDDTMRSHMWWVPVSYVTKSQPNFEDTKPKFWLRGENETKVDMDVKNGYLLNLKHTGYYIVNYDEKNWKQIVDNMMNFPMLVRAQLLSNAMDLARANLLDYDIPLKLFLVVGRRDNNLVPYSIAFDKINYLYNMLITKSIFTKFQDYFEIVFNTAFDNTVLSENPVDGYAVQRLRSTILNWSCKNSESRCVTQARLLYRALMISNKPVQANLRQVVYCTAIREGGETDFNFAYEMYLNTSVPSEKQTLLTALGCTHKPWLLERYLNMMLDPASGIRKQDGRFVFAAVANNFRGHQIAFTFLRENWNALKDYYGLAFNRLSVMVESLGVYMNKVSDLEQLEAFKNEVDLATAQGAYEYVYENVRMNVDWMQNCFKSVENWLKMPSEHFGY